MFTFVLPKISEDSALAYIRSAALSAWPRPSPCPISCRATFWVPALLKPWPNALPLSWMDTTFQDAAERTHRLGEGLAEDGPPPTFIWITMSAVLPLESRMS